MRIVILVAAVAAVLAAQASARPAADTLIRPGVGIGKARLGMTQAQVRAAMGRPQATLTKKGAFGRTVIEWQYGYGAYTVEFSGRARALRVTALSTSALRERTPEGFGVGTREAVLVKRFGGKLRCERLRVGTIGGSPNHEIVLDRNRDCVLTHADGRKTVFITSLKRVGMYDEFVEPEKWPDVAQVLAIAVRAA